MAHFAEMDGNRVVRVIVVSNNDAPTEEAGIAFCRMLYGQNTNWLQTSYNRNIRKNFAGIGYTYDARLDAFIAPRPSPSYVLNEETCRWELPSSVK